MSDVIKLHNAHGNDVAVTRVGSVNTPHVAATFIDGPNTDAFGRLRVSNPETVFDSKQLFDNGPLFWDDQETSGGGTSSSHSTARASSMLAVSASTAGTRVRQTFRRFNYQPGKSQLILMTGVLGAAATGITRRVGYFDSNDGIFLEQTEDGVFMVIRSSVTGSPVNTRVAQADWNVDKLDGTGDSLLTFDETMAQILVIDLEWLGVGRVRVGFNIHGQTYYVHEFNHANLIDSVYMSTPNLPLRYEISNDGTGGAATLEHICSSVISEGGREQNGRESYISTNGVHVDANIADTIYAVVGVQLKSTHLGATVQVEDISLLAESQDAYEWMLILNPTVAGTFTYSDETNSALQAARGATANTVTGGVKIAGGFANTASATTGPIKTAINLGAKIDGTRDTLVLCVRTLGSNSDIQGGMTLRELL